uniref:MP putative movement protein n=1 Tax=Canadian violet rhabdovirus 2 TaxID=2933135 RepID=A0A9C7LLN2_9RHAB|nr:MP putative movement protein [Canadian violet rhabdovirus 2]CAI5383922.1 MP putative movement protein [Canadian violet rhabdovirus 2]
MSYIYATSIKGHASVSFNSPRRDMTTSKTWNIITKIFDIKPSNVLISYSAARDKKGGEEVDTNTRGLLKEVISGCIDTVCPPVSESYQTDIYLGKCSKYTIPFGTISKDTGHLSVIMSLPFLEDGCYNMGARFKGKSGSRRTGTLSHYMVDASLELYIKLLSPGEAESEIGKGIKVYPFMLRHPEYFGPSSDTSDNESTDHTAISDDDTDPGEPEHKSSSRDSTNLEFSKLKRKTLPLKRRINKKKRELMSFVSNKISAPSSSQAPPVEDTQQ